MAAAQKRCQQTIDFNLLSSGVSSAMSLYSIPKKKHTAFYDNVLTPRDPDAKTRKASKISVENVKSDDTRSLDKTKELNTTCVISGLSKSRGQKNDIPVLGRLALQRRKTGANGDKTRSENTMDMTPNSTPASEKTLSLQRRTRTGSIDKSAGNDMSKAEGSRQRWVSGTDSNQSKGLSESNPRTTGNAGVLQSFSLRDTSSKSQSREAVNLLLNTPTKGVERFPSRFAPKQPATPGKVDVTKPEDQTKTFSTPTRKTPFEKITAKKDAFERLAGKKGQKVVAVKTTSLERLKKHAQVTVEAAKPGATHRSKKFPLSSQGANVASTFPPTQVRKNSIHSDVSVARSSTPAPTSYVSTEPLVRSKPDTLKMENSAVTVAVRVRPFNTREKTEKASQVIFMDNQETVVQHPDTKQRHAFTYDFSFCSVDKSDPGFASQQTVYEKLAKPLLERAFEGFNTCLFAYGQTGSGKSYTMMGFGEEAGLTPRFCQDLFSRLSPVDNQVTCHLGMSYFEVYNEKIHDLLVIRDEQNHKRLPLRVREHPVDGPYVAELSTNVVSSYEDIQGWLELGNKQRATAATGMNDKSSRSHSVFTLVMTQTKTEFVEGEEHDHRITSRINLVDLAGSERCSSAQTSGDRLVEGASINKSLLSLGKVISALSEQAQTRRKVFTPYREAVLTWLLKESLGGNSKTAMIATLSPAGSNVEESLSTLRYAKQARMIINVAKVNEDTNAKLIRELKAEVEKLRAAQMSSQGIEPEKMHLFQQEILALKSQLTQQEREMTEAHRAWREKLEQAEKHKREETEELQKAGVTFAVDNRLPNLVNLNEDPQLSEMLLYMIKEGQTEVGQHKSESPHDIQLSGALIADRHCVISNVNGEVSITPMENAKTFVNGNLVSDTTVLCHGDRVILGGDHYFRFNHPAEVQSGKRVSCWTGAGDGQKDFEFAKNELLSAQRAQLEEEIEEARLKAKEEMMQGILVAKEMAQEELSDQKARYENRIKALERELEEESERKRHWEMDQQQVASKMEELQSAKVELEQEVDTHRTRLRLHMEAQATRRAMDDHGVRQAKVVEALEAEKRKIGKDLEEMQRKLALKGSRTPKNVPPRWDAMKLSLMIEEANKISDKLKKNTVFSRHEGSEKKCGEGELQVQVKNTKLGISTFWSLEKFQSNLAAIRELDQGDRSASKDDDVFYDPNDEWEQDMSASSTAASFSRRRSRSLLKSRRISGRLYEIRVHPIQSLHNSNLPQSSGLLGVAKPPSLHPSSSDSILPGICKDLIGQTVGQLRECHSHEESMADRLTSDLCCVHTAVTTISDLYDGLDNDSEENMFVFEAEAQSQLVKATSAIQRAVFITMQWVTSIDPRTATLYVNAEELKTQVKRMGGYFQLLIQGCDSEISSMVNEAHGKSGQCLDSALQVISHLAALTGTQLHVTELWAEATGKRSVVLSLLEGTCKGVHSLLEEGLTISKEMLSDAQLTYPRTPVLQSLKSKTLDLSCALQSYIHCHMTERDEGSERSGEDLDPSHLHRVKNTAAKLFQLNQAIRQLHSALSLALRGKTSDACEETVFSSSKTIEEVINSLPSGATGSATNNFNLRLPCVQTVMAARDELHAALQSLSNAFNPQGNEEEKTGSFGSEKSLVEMSLVKEGPLVASAMGMNRGDPKIVYSLSSGVSSSNDDDVCWV
ncbi:kinesin-like protein KIF14 isoform X2 [Salmo trutta]|uniref:kinesin-like protein KIF14 isoform X2 n=1 Tax=Salmo trutta TaxID=8032 RepID=UPI0011325933|nr:kinesin-like protein KIF14 isoform X2 [Salmo trutta]